MFPRAWMSTTPPGLPMPDKTLALREVYFQFCCFPCDEGWWLQQQLLDSSVVCKCKEKPFPVGGTFPAQTAPFFTISRENMWAGLKLLLASFSCIMLFNRMCPIKSASIVVFQDLYYMYRTLISLENTEWRNLLFQFWLQN